MKSEILSIMGNIIVALNKVQIMPGKENWLNQGGAIAMMEDVYHRIETQLEDKQSGPEGTNKTET